MPDYSKNEMNWKEKGICVGKGMLAALVVDYLFYESWIMFLMLLVIPAGYYRYSVSKRKRERIHTLNAQFRYALEGMNTAVQAGYSAENAVLASLRDLEKLYGKQQDIVREFRYIEHQLKLSIPLDQLFLELGRRSHGEDIENFALVFSTARKSGGNLAEILQKTADMLGDKMQVEQEIQAILAAKKMEQRIMSFMPAGIIAYLKVSSPDFLKVLYGNGLGVTAMTICLAVYVFAWYLGERMMEIEV